MPSLRPATPTRRRRRRAVAGLTVLVSTVLVATACTDQSANRADPGPPRDGGTLQYGLSQAPTCADPAQASTNQTVYVTRPVVDSLTDQDPRTGAVIPWLARSWEVSPDATRFTFRLRPGVTFSDGTAVDAGAVARSLDSVTRTLGAVKAPLGASYLSGYVGTTVIDPLTAQVVFSGPNAQFLQATSTPQLGIVAASTAAKSAEQRCQGGIVGSGPFTYADYQQDRSATLDKRRGYNWGSAVFDHTGEARVDRVDFTVVPESGVRTGSLASGQLDAVSDALPQDKTIIEGSGGQILTVPNPGIPFGLQPNVSRGVLADRAVRTALLPAINRTELVETVLDRSFRPATGALASTTPGYVASPSIRFDPAASRAQLQAAGWVPGRDGIRTKNGTRLSFGVTFSAVFSGNQTILELLQQQLRAVGVDLRLELVSVAESVTRQNSGDFDTVYYNSTRADGDILRTTFSVDQRNLGRSPAIPALQTAFAGELATTDTTARMAYLRTAQDQILAEGLFLPTIELSQAIGQGPRTHGLRFDASARLQFHDVWLSEDR